MTNSTGRGLFGATYEVEFRAMEMLPREVRIALWGASGNWSAEEVWQQFNEARAVGGRDYATERVLRMLRAAEEEDLRQRAHEYRVRHGLPLPAFGARATFMQWRAAA